MRVEATLAAPVSKPTLWAGRIMTGVSALFLLFDVVIHMMKIAPVVESFAQLGYPEYLARPIGVVEAVCLLIFLIPRSSALGAILLTGYLGGAVASNLRVGYPLFSHVLFPIYLGLLIWGGLYLRDSRLRTLLPLRST